MPQNLRWVEKCPERVEKRLLNLAAARMKVTERSDPTRFAVRDAEGKEFHCTLGCPHLCSCKYSQPCMHVLAVLTSFFNAAVSNPIVWQQYIRELDLQDLIDKRVATQKCFFCREEATCGDFCCACGTQFHSLCFELAAKSKKYGQGCCPRCGAKEVRKAQVNATFCSNCSKKCGEEHFVCLLCPAIYLCAVCHALPKVHASHPFQHVQLPGRPSVAEGAAPSRVGDLQYREINPEDYETLLHLDTTPTETLTRAELGRLPVEAFVLRERINEACPICLVSFTADSACVVLPCCHVLHQRCGMRWFSKYSAVCPVDKSPVAPKSDSEGPPATRQCKSPAPLFENSTRATRCTQAGGRLKLPSIVQHK